VADLSLLDLYKDHDGKVSDKWELYLSEYDRLLSRYRKKPLSVLEIGVQNGGSLEIWAKYFPEAERIFGCDIDPSCAELQFEDSRISVFVGDANSSDTKSKILCESPEFEVVIDDGSHTSTDIVESFVGYFSHVSEGGVYIIEDLHCSYWQEFEGGIFAPFSSMSFCKMLADNVNHEHWGVEKSRSELFKGFSAQYGVEITDNILQQVHSVEFFNSVCVVKKMDAKCNILGARFVTGGLQHVRDGLLELSGSSIALPQFSNIWSQSDLPPSEEIPKRLQDIAELSEKIVALTQTVEDHEAEVVALTKSVEDHEAEVVALTKSVEDHEAEVVALTKSVEDHEAEVVALTKSLIDRDAQLVTLAQTVENIEAQTADVTAHLVNYKKALSDVYGSISWRIMRPARYLRSLF
jgi:SAM-dependent methyltransferase